MEEAGEEAEDTTRFLSFDGYLSQEAEKTMRIYETGLRQDDSRQGS